MGGVATPCDGLPIIPVAMPTVVTTPTVITIVSLFL